MTKNISELTSPAARSFAERCINAFPALHENKDFFRTVERVFQYSFVRYMYSDLSFIRQLHISAFPENDQQIAVIYVMFRDGRVQGIKLTGSFKIEAVKICLIADEMERFVQADGGRVDADEQESHFNANFARWEQFGVVFAHFQSESYIPTKENLNVALSSICHVLVRAIEAKIKLNPTEIGLLRSLVVESFPAFSNGSDKLNEFVKQVDADAVSAITELERVVNCDPFEKTYCISFNQLSSYNYFASGDPILKRKRVEAIFAFPWMAPYVMEYVQGQQKFSETANFELALSRAAHCQWGQPLSEAIDAGRPLIYTAATLFGVAEEVIEWSRGRPIIFHTLPFLKKIDNLLKILSFIRPEKRPDSSLGWHDLQFTLRNLVRSFQYFVDEGESGENSFGNDERLANLLAMPNMRQILRQRFEEFDLMTTSLGGTKSWLRRNFWVGNDFLVTVCDAARARCAENYETGSTETTRPFTLLMAWQAERTLRDINNASLRWHLELQEELVLLGDASAAVRPIVLETPFEFDDVHVVQITNYQQFIDEVRGMNFDRYKYRDFSLYGTSQIFSIRNQDNLRLSTLELGSSYCGDVTDETKHISLMSHHGFKNTMPSDLCEKTASALIDFLNAHNCAKLFDEFSRVTMANFDLRRKETITRESAGSKYDIVSEAVAWRCAFSSEQEAQSFLERFRSH